MSNMFNYDIHLEKLDELCDLLDKEGVTGNVIDRLNSCGEPSVSIWKGPYARHLEKGFNSSDILFKVYWFPIQKTYCLVVKNEKYDNIMKKFYQPDIGNHYIFTTPQLIVTTIKMLFSNEENINMNKDQKREEAINSLIHELTIRNIIWSGMGVLHDHPTIRIYNNCAIADIHILATNSEYVYAIEPATSRFREHLKNSKYRYARTYPCTDDWYVYITSRTVGCVIRDFLDTLLPHSEPKIFDKLYAKEVIFNDPATIVMWSDGSKTVVKAENERFDPEKGLAMAISKRMLGNKHNYYDFFKKHIGRYEKKQTKKAKKEEK